MHTIGGLGAQYYGEYTEIEESSLAENSGLILRAEVSIPSPHLRCSQLEKGPGQLEHSGHSIGRTEGPGRKVESAFQLAGYLTIMARRDTLPGRLCSSLCQSLVQEATTLSYLDTTVTQARGLHH